MGYVYQSKHLFESSFSDGVDPISLNNVKILDQCNTKWMKCSKVRCVSVNKGGKVADRNSSVVRQGSYLIRDCFECDDEEKRFSMSSIWSVQDDRLDLLFVSLQC